MYESDSGQQSPRGGLILLQCLILGLFCLFTVRLWYLQVHKGEHFSDLARENQMRQASIIAARGTIMDRNGKPLAVNEPSFALGLIREDCEDVQGTLRKVSEWTGLDYQMLLDTYIRGKKRSKPFEPLVLISNLSYELLAKIEANAVSWPGLEILIRSRRYYPDGELLAHVLGYVAEANEEELEKDSSLALGDQVGKQGLEYVTEDRLRGEKGLKQIEVDAYGREHDQQVLLEPKAGGDMRLAIDIDLQAVCAKQLEGQAGSVVVLEPDTGKILALVSEPSYDSNLFVLGIPPKKWQELRDDPMHPIQNRVSQSVYPPGSTFKLLMAACALSEGVIKPTDTVFCTGSYQVGDHEFHCWKKGGHGTVDMRSALVHSCDVYFYQLGEKLGIDRINRFALQCGFGAPTGIDLPHERSGLIPSTAWKKRRYGENWTRGETLNCAIGQGYVQVSPLQLAKFIGALVTGKVIRPSLVLDDPVDVQSKLPLADKDREFILRAMVDTVQGGTAQKLKRPDAVIGGKTGTAQVVKLQVADNKVTQSTPYKYRDHAWIATWGQKDGKSYVVVCMVEHGGHAGDAAAPVVKVVYDHLFGPAPGTVKAAQPDTPSPAENGD
jgi:penicillin-binding protein 2